MKLGEHFYSKQFLILMDTRKNKYLIHYTQQKIRNKKIWDVYIQDIHIVKQVTENEDVIHEIGKVKFHLEMF